MPDIDKRDEIVDMPLKKNVGDVVAYVNSIFKNAIEFDASDIHIEPMEPKYSQKLKLMKIKNLRMEK